MAEYFKEIIDEKTAELIELKHKFEKLTEEHESVSTRLFRVLDESTNSVQVIEVYYSFCILKFHSN
jgi:hypothetical protein